MDIRAIFIHFWTRNIPRRMHISIYIGVAYLSHAHLYYELVTEILMLDRSCVYMIVYMHC